MPKTKVVIDFSTLPMAELAPKASAVDEAMTENAATFPAPPVSMAALHDLIETFKQKLAARSSRATADVLALQLARENLLKALSLLGSYVNNVAQGRAEIAVQSGFPTYSTAKTPNFAPPGPPQNLRLEHGRLPGQVIARCQPERAPSTNEAQVCTDDPNVEANWRSIGHFTGGRTTLEDLPPGKLIYIRVRTLGLKGVLGAWSDVAMIRVV